MDKHTEREQEQVSHFHPQLRLSLISIRASTGWMKKKEGEVNLFLQFTDHEDDNDNGQWDAVAMEWK
jgi:hypothetical protein